VPAASAIIAAMDLGLGGKRVLVTAASKGLGRAVAEGFLREGARVCISSSSPQRIEATAAALRDDPGGEVHALAADLTSPSECDRLFAWAVETLGGLDVLVNNTVGPPVGGVLGLTDEQWDTAYRSIFVSALRLSRAAVPVMRQGGGGSIVNLASMTAKQPIDGLTLSNAFRPALIGMAKSLSREAGPEVRVNSIATEHILTDRIRDIAEQAWQRDGETVDQTIERMSQEVPLKRYGTPREFANAVVFVASDAASYIDGVTLAVDGGLGRGLF
jgi:3-oxoacyl-[acyl-carrier protein] reductase